MILLEKLTIRDFGTLHQVDLEFRPRGQHLIVVDPGQAQALRLALITSLYGMPDDNRARFDGASIECTLAANGHPVSIRRSLRATSRDETEVIGQQGYPKANIGNGARGQEAIDAIVGLDQDTFQLLIHPDPMAALLPHAKVDDLVRRLLGMQRLREMQFEFSERPELHEEEVSARARVELATAVAHATAAADEANHLERELQEWRVRQALIHLESVSSRASTAKRSVQERIAIRTLMREQRAGWRLRGELASLWIKRAQQVTRTATFKAAVSRASAVLDELAPLEQHARVTAERLVKLDSICEAFALSNAAASAADHARRQRDTYRKSAHQLVRARAQLAEAETIQTKLRSRAERENTLLGRKHESANLPAAHRLWGDLHEILLTEEHHGDHSVADTSRSLDVTRTRQQLRAIKIARQQRRTRVLAASIGVTLGITLTAIGLASATPVSLAGIAIGTVGATVGLWSLSNERTYQSAEDRLRNHLEDLEGQDSNREQHASSTASHRNRRALIENGLKDLSVEVPKSPDRARVLRDSATIRLRNIVDGDLDAHQKIDHKQTLHDLAQAENEVHRIGARIDALAASGPEGRMAGSETKLRHEIEASGRARSQASELTHSLGLPDSHDAVLPARDAHRRKLEAMRAQLDRTHEIDQGRSQAERSRQTAANALHHIDQQIDRIIDTDFGLARLEPSEEVARNLATIAILADTIMSVADMRSASDERLAKKMADASDYAVTRASTELTNAVRATGSRIDQNPTAAEVRAMFPDLEAEQLQDPGGSRERLRKARASRSKLDDQIRRLELRTGLLRDDVDSDAAQAALRELVEQRRVRTAASRMMTEALDTLASGVPATTEATLRQIIGPVTQGLYWDVRIDPDMTVKVWDEKTDAWKSLPEIGSSQSEALKLAVSTSFIAAIQPHDASQAPAFIWLEVGNSGPQAPAIEALLDSLTRTNLRNRFPQVIVTAPTGILSPAQFDQVFLITSGTSSSPAEQTVLSKQMNEIG